MLTYFVGMWLFHDERAHHVPWEHPSTTWTPLALKIGGGTGLTAVQTVLAVALCAVPHVFLRPDPSSSSNPSLELNAHRSLWVLWAFFFVPDVKFNGWGSHLNVLHSYLHPPSSGQLLQLLLPPALHQQGQTGIAYKTAEVHE